MTDVAASLAVGLAGFMTGMAYANRGHLIALRYAADARAVVVEGRAYVLAPLYPDPVTAPAPPRPGTLTVLPGGKPEDVA